MQRLSLAATVICLLLIGCQTPQPTPGPAVLAARDVEPSSPRWAEAMERFAEEDATLDPHPDRVLFLGSSSIRGWPLDETFPDLDTLNRGFGGSQICDSIHFFERLVITHQPQVIVFYAGDNDVAAGKDALQVFDDYRLFTAMVHEALPETVVIFVPIKPSILRWEMWPTMREANTLIRGHSAALDWLEYVDTATPMLDPETGEPRSELFVEDGLHLSPEGYRLWTSIVRPMIDEVQRRDR